MSKDAHPTPTAKRWACCFPQPAGELVDTAVDEMWKAGFGVQRTPFGDLRNMWRRHHCRTLNPYGDDSCPYAKADCAQAFADAIRLTVNARPRVPVGYFLKVAKSTAAQRADDKPLARNRGRMDVPEHDLGGGTHQGMDQGSGLRRPTTGPISLGDLFGSLGIQPHQGPRSADDGEASPER